MNGLSGDCATVAALLFICALLVRSGLAGPPGQRFVVVDRINPGALNEHLRNISALYIAHFRSPAEVGHGLCETTKERDSALIVHRWSPGRRMSPASRDLLPVQGP